jgi:GDP-4-dehydro-6-deoxy-D-mannose reductase
MRILITGVTGFIGGHLVEHLGRAGGHHLFGVSRQGAFAPEWAHLDGRVQLHAAELSDRAAVEAILREVRPDALYHLAGYSNPRDAGKNAEQCWADNFGSTEALYAAVLASGVRPRVLFASTGHVYGNLQQGTGTCDEQTPTNARGPYAESKLKAEELSVRTANESGLDIVCVRLFNQIGPRQSKGFVVSDYASQIAEVEAGKRAGIRKGDLSGYRDFTDVRDVVVALDLLMTTQQPVRGRIFNAASGRLVQLDQIVDSLCGMARTSIPVETAGDGSPRSQLLSQTIDVSALRQLTGWRPRYELDQTLRDTLDYWRTVVARS